MVYPVGHGFYLYSRMSSHPNLLLVEPMYYVTQPADIYNHIMDQILRSILKSLLFPQAIAGELIHVRKIIRRPQVSVLGKGEFKK